MQAGIRPYGVAYHRWVCAKSNCARAGVEGLDCRLGRCFCILPYAEVSAGDPHPAPTGVVPQRWFARIFLSLRHFSSKNATSLVRRRIAGDSRITPTG